MRRTVALTSIGVAATALLITLPGTGAAADTSPVGIGVARTVDDERGNFRVPVWTDATGGTLTTVTASIRDGDQVVDTAALSDPDHDGYWTPAAPLKLSSDGGSMPHLGRYAIDVTAQDSDDDTATRADAGVLDFTLRPWFAQQLNFPGAPLTLQQHTTTVTGKLQGIEPGTGAFVPLDGQTVSVTRSYYSDMPDRPDDTTVQATTGADGTFTTTEFVQDWNASYDATFSADDDVVHGTAGVWLQRPEIDRQQVDLAASADRIRAEPGQQIKISGTAEIGGNPVPDGTRIGLSLASYNLYYRDPQAVVTTQSGGTFSGAITAIDGYGSGWTATVIGPWLSGTASGPITIPAEASYTHVSVSLGANGRVVAHAVLDYTYEQNLGVLHKQVTRLEYSKDGKSNWKVLATARAYDGSIKLSAWGHVRGYYRLYHPTSDEFAHTSTTPAYRGRIPTRIAHNNASPEPVHKDGTVTVTGTLQQYKSGGWHAMGGQRVFLYFRPSGSNHWSWFVSGKTDSHGHITLHTNAVKSGWWLLQYFGDSNHFNSGANADYVKVT